MITIGRAPDILGAGWGWWGARIWCSPAGHHFASCYRGIVGKYAEMTSSLLWRLGSVVKDGESCPSCCFATPYIYTNPEIHCALVDLHQSWLFPSFGWIFEPCVVTSKSTDELWKLQIIAFFAERLAFVITHLISSCWDPSSSKWLWLCSLSSLRLDSLQWSPRLCYL